MSTYLPLGCLAGECGLVITDSSLQCPVSCATHTQCSTCVQSPRCGWCALGRLNGVGVCMEGGYAGPVPAAGLCTDSNVVVTNETLSGEQSTLMLDSHDSYDVSSIEVLLQMLSTASRSRVMLQLQ